jgi:hypothetical protein
MEFSVTDRSLLVFVDNTGHEALVLGHPVYDLGGCAFSRRISSASSAIGGTKCGAGSAGLLKRPCMR